MTMDARRWPDVVATFDELVELEPVAQEQRLAAIGTSDPELRRGVEELLAADAQAEERLTRMDQVLNPQRSARHESEHDPDPLELIGRMVSHFRVIEPLASGGMGVVYRAEDTQLRRAIALKFPLPSHHFDRSAKERFLREARVAGALDHPNLCPIYEAGVADDGNLFYAMPLYEGETLKERLAREGALPVTEALHIAKQISTGLGAAHKSGIVHRDLKPANVMLLRDATVRILDFGLAKGSDLSVTDPWTTLGTVSYMAPEQVQGHEVDRRADLWALGVVLYEMLTGQRPFSGDFAIGVAHAIVHDEPERPSSLRGEITRETDAVVHTLLCKDPALRYASAEDVTAALDALSRDRPARRRGMSTGNRALRISMLAALPLLAGALTIAGILDIGPVASLGRSTLSPSDALLVADFDIRGADSSLGSTLATLVRMELRQSNVVTLVPDSTIRAGLQRMRRPAGAPLSSADARELAQREGIKAVVEGDLTPLGAGFVVTVRLVSARGDELVSLSGTTDLDNLIPAIETLARRLRRRIGESLENVRASPPLQQVTTSSFAALRKFVDAGRSLGVENVALLKEAVALDTTFAMAWIALYAAYRNGTYPTELSNGALEHAYRYRDRLPAWERYHVVGSYFRAGPGRDRARAAQAYEAGIRMDSGTFANSLGLLYMSRREYARAESLFRWKVGRRGDHANLSNALYFQGKRTEAESVEAENARRFPDAKRWGRAAFYLYNRGQLDSAQETIERQRAEGDATQRVMASRYLSYLHLVRGRLAEAQRAWSQAAEENLARGAPPDLLGDQLWAASVDIWYRDPLERGVRNFERVFARAPAAWLSLASPSLELYYLWVARTYARAGRSGRARAMLMRFDNEVRDTSVKRASAPEIHGVLGEIALAERKPLLALEEFRSADRLRDGPVAMFALGLHANVGRAFDQAGMADSAIANFERYLDTPQLDRTYDDAKYLARILQRLGALYEAKGDRTRAIGYYERFVELWRKADPELQPQVAEARRRIELMRVSEKR